VQLRIFTEPQQGADYDTLLAIARKAEDCGFDAFFRSDHYLRIGDGDPGPGPTDAWVTLAGLARDTSRIRLGTLVSSATFRHPGSLAIAVATVDQMSRGRVDFGLGAGWFEREHTAYGIEFPDLGERFERLAEQLEIITGLWGTPVGESYSFEGRHYRVVDSPALPKPYDSPPPVIVGGGGPKRTPALAATFADEFNIAFRSLDDSAAAFDRVREACAETGRSIVYSAAQTVCCGRDEAELERRAAAIGRDLDDLRMNGVAGTPAEVVDRIGQFAELGATRMYLQVLDLHDLDHVELIATEVMPALAS
jgi:F420-dependent oxidoreductase-like protein